MKEGAIDRERAVVAHDQAPEVTEPGVGAFDNPSPPVAPQRGNSKKRKPRSPVNCDLFCSSLFQVPYLTYNVPPELLQISEDGAHVNCPAQSRLDSFRFFW